MSARYVAMSTPVLYTLIISHREFRQYEFWLVVCLRESRA